MSMYCKKCKMCKKEFYVTVHNKLFCSNLCYKKNRSLEEKADKKYRECCICGDIFELIIWNKKICGDKCKKIYIKKHYIENKEKLREYQKDYTKNNREKRNLQILNSRKKSPEKYREYQRNYEKERKENDLNYKLKKSLRSNINSALIYRVAGKKYESMELLGCSIENFKTHLELKFKTGMTFKNHGKWHIDHIVPCSLFDLTDPYQQKLCFNYTNLQPLWACENMKKGAKLL